MTTLRIKRILYTILFGLLLSVWCILPSKNEVLATPAPNFKDDFASQLTNEKERYLLNPSDFCISSAGTLRDNVTALFYPSSKSECTNAIYKLIRDIALWVMICFIVWAWASLLFNRKPETMKKTLWNLIYILIWWVFIYAANRLFWTVLNFNWANGSMTSSVDGQNGFWAVVNQFTWAEWVMFLVLSAIKGFAFFMAIILTVITWFRVVAAGEWEKGKKLVKWLINILVALLIIKWIDFIYYLAADSWHFAQKAADLIINFAKIFGYVYWSLIVIMILLAWYLYMTDWWNWSNFKKATNILVNILLSWLVLFSFLLIMYQIFAEFQEWWDAVSVDTTQSQQIVSNSNNNTNTNTNNTPSSTDTPGNWGGGWKREVLDIDQEKTQGGWGRRDLEREVMEID